MLKTEPYPAADFLVPEGLEAQWFEARRSVDPDDGEAKKKARHDQFPKWKQTHEQFFSKHKMSWPPAESALEQLKAFRDREREVIIAADLMWPEDTVGRWQWFDTNHTMERSFGLNAALEGKSPWQLFPPTFTAQSSVVGRLLHASGAKSFKKISAVEGFRMQGWDFAMWSTSPVETPAKVLDSLLGNGWSMFNFLPLLIAACGCWNYALLPSAHGVPGHCDDASQDSGALSSQTSGCST